MYVDSLRRLVLTQAVTELVVGDVYMLDYCTAELNSVCQCEVYYVFTHRI